MIVLKQYQTKCLQMFIFLNASYICTYDRVQNFHHNFSVNFEYKCIIVTHVSFMQHIKNIYKNSQPNFTPKVRLNDTGFIAFLNRPPKHTSDNNHSRVCFQDFFPKFIFITL